MTVYYDGVCVFCSRWVRFVIARDRRKLIRFCALQSERAAGIRERGSAGNDDIATIVVELDDGTILTKSTASLSVFRYIGLPASLLSVFLLVPIVIRDAVYDYIGKRRYKIFGKYDTCPMPDPAVRVSGLGASPEDHRPGPRCNCPRGCGGFLSDVPGCDGRRDRAH